MKKLVSTSFRSPGLALALSLALFACESDDPASTTTDAGVAAGGKDPNTAPKAAIDRFSPGAGTLMVRDASNGLPAADAPIDFDEPPFVTQGLGPAGQVVAYYNFDVQPEAPAPIYVFFAPGATAPVAGQLNVIDVIPGDAGYSDFWQVHKVTVPPGYVANSITSLAALVAAGFTIEPTTMLVNCPVVPEGSTASRRLGGGATALVTGWYRDMTVRYFSFEEKSLTGASVPTSPIYVTFNLNPAESGGGPPSGFKTEPGSPQTHNVVATIPSDAGYSPLWSVNIYDNAAFANVSDLASAMAAPLLVAGAAKVNCPIVQVGAAAATQVVPTQAASLKSFLESKAYATFKAEPAPHPSAGPHGRVRTFVNDVLAASLAAGNTVHPQGAASVKELYTGDEVTGWAVLVKTQADSAGGAGYYWYEILNGNVIVDGNGKTLCTGCHAGGTDYVLTKL